MINYLYKVGATFIDIANFTYGHSKFCLRVSVRGVLSSRVFNPAVFAITLRQIYFTGVELFYIMTFVALILGAAIVGSLTKFTIALGIKESIGSILTLTIIRMVGPLISGLLIILRSSTSLIVEIGMMKYNREIKSIQAMGIDPFIYVYFPRVFASLISTFVLSTYFVVVSIIGGYILLSFQLDTTLDSILGQVIYNISFSDVFCFLFKTILIGFLAASIPIYTALEIGGSPTDMIKSFVYGMIRLFFFFIIILVIGELI